MRECEKCGSEVKVRSITWHLFKNTLKLSLGIAFVASIFGMYKIVDIAMSLLVLIPFSALVLYPFKIATVHKCTNSDCGNIEYKYTETFVCGTCESDDNVKRIKITPKISLLGGCLVVVAYFMPQETDVMYSLSQLLFYGGIGTCLLAVILEKFNIFNVKLKCKHCGKTIIVSKEKAAELQL